MDYVHLSVIGSSIGTISIIFVYIYLYAVYRERCLGLWAISWLILLSRYLIFDTGLLPWRHSIWGLTIYQMLIFISVLMFTWSTHIFINRPLNKGWLYSTAGLAILNFTFNFLGSSLIYKLLPSIFFGCFVCIWVGLIFIWQLKLPGIGHLITGYAYILWSLLNLAAPFTLGGSWVLPWSFMIGGTLRLVIAIGTLMVYFEKTRLDLVIKETQYRLLAENAIDVIYHYQLWPEKKIQYVSPSVLTVTGYTPEDYYADHKLVLKLIHPDDQPALRKFINDFPPSAELPLTLRLIRKNKSLTWLEQKCVPIYDEKDRIIGVEGIVRDISARKSLEQMASLFDRMNLVGNMAATVAHEIRNPMTTVRGYLQLLGRKEKNIADKDKFKLMIEEIDRANTIIREYLSLSREKASDFKTCSLNAIIETLFPLIQAHANSAKIFVHLDLADIPELLLDENEIRQLLLNLIRNGIEAMTTSGNIIIRTFSENNKVVLAISDQGPGIPPEVLDKLGTPFVTTKDNGTGLGLPICYQIAKRHNANIKIDTGDSGTTFFVYFN